jgi:mannose-6-phosphate isomerase-like protein (cupin superfamily)
VPPNLSTAEPQPLRKSTRLARHDVGEDIITDIKNLHRPARHQKLAQWCAPAPRWFHRHKRRRTVQLWPRQETRLNIPRGPLELIDIKAMAESSEYKWFNQALCQVNGSVVRVGIEGEYHWHKHGEEDEFFYVVEGRLLIDLEDKTIDLNPDRGFVVPRSVLHRTRAPERTVILMVENAGTIPTGN